MGSCRDPDRRNKPPQVKAGGLLGREAVASGRVDHGEGGDAESKGRMQASPSAQDTCAAARGGNHQVAASSFRPPAIPGVPGWVQGAGHPWSWGCCCGLSACFFSSPVKPGFQFLPTRLVGWARPDRVGAWGRRSPEASWGQEPQTGECLHFSTPPPPSLGGVCREGEGKGWGPQVIFPGTGHSLASSGREGGAHCL